MNVWLVGGEKVIPTSVEAAIKGDGYTVSRINGSDRYETAAMVAEAGIKMSGKKPSKVFVASGASFADALAVSPIAFAKGYPIILTEKDSTSDFSKKELGNIGTDAKILVGGEAVVSNKVKADLSITTRVAGDDRAVTANLVSDWAKASEGFSKANAALVGGTNGNGADSLVAAAPAGKAMTTLHFAGWDATTVYLKDHAAELTGKGWVFGGKAAVPGDQVDKAQAAAQTVVSTQAVTVTGGGNIDPSAAYLATKASTYQEYTVVAPTGVTELAIQLVDSRNISKDSSGNVSFAKVSGFPRADFSNPNTPDLGDLKIYAVNGIDLTSAATSVATAPVINGKVTFRVAGTAATSIGKVVPVVFKSSSSYLTVDSAGKPTAPFGVGAATMTMPNEQVASSTALSAAGVEVLALSSDQFIGKTSATAGGKFNYRTGDTYKIGGATVTKAAFVAALSEGDQLTVTYAQQLGAAGTFAANSFDIVNDKVAVATNVAVATFDSSASGADDKTRITFTAPKENLLAFANVQRATVVNGVVGDFGTATTEAVTYSGTSGKIELSSVPTAGQYVYRVSLVGLASVSTSTPAVVSDKSAPSNVLTVSAGAAPKAVYTHMTTASGLANSLDGGDVITIAYDNPLAAMVDGDTIQVKDADGTIGSLVRGSTATTSTMVLNTTSVNVNGVSYGAGQVLTVTVGSSGITPSTAGSVTGLQLPLTIIDQSGIGSSSSSWNVSGSTDLTVES